MLATFFAFFFLDFHLLSLCNDMNPVFEKRKHLKQQATDLPRYVAKPFIMHGKI